MLQVASNLNCLIFVVFLCLVWPLTSGARYSGVPQKVFMVAVSVMPSLQRPKSVILMWPSLSNMRFSSWWKRMREIKHMTFCFSILHVKLMNSVQVSNTGFFSDVTQSRCSLPSDHDRQSWQNVGSLEQRRSQRRRNECGPPKKLFLLTNGKTAAKKKFIRLRHFCCIKSTHPVKTSN